MRWWISVGSEVRLGTEKEEEEGPEMTVMVMFLLLVDAWVCENSSCLLGFGVLEKIEICSLSALSLSFYNLKCIYSIELFFSGTNIFLIRSRIIALTQGGAMGILLPSY